MAVNVPTGGQRGEIIVSGRSKERPSRGIIHPISAGKGVFDQPPLDNEFVVDSHDFPVDPNTGLLLARPLRGAISFEAEVRGQQFVFDVLNSRAYLDHHEQWRDEVIIPLYARGFNRSLQLATMLVVDKMRVSREESRREDLIPSAILIRKKTPSGDVYVGEALERVYIIPTTAGDKHILSFETRVMEGGFRDMEFGRKLAQLARLTHNRATWGTHRTRVEPSPRSLQKARIFKPGRYFPYDAPYDSDFVALQILNGYFARVKLNGRSVTQEYGVSYNDYLDPTGELGFDPKHPSLLAINRLFLRARLIPQDPEKRKLSTHSMYGTGEFANAA